MDIPALVAAMCIPSALTGFCFWMLERRITRREAEQDRKDEATGTCMMRWSMRGGSSMNRRIS